MTRTLTPPLKWHGGWQRHEFELPNNAAPGASKRRMLESVWCNY